MKLCNVFRTRSFQLVKLCNVFRTRMMPSHFFSVGQGAATTLHCCVGEQHSVVRGGAYFEDCAEAIPGPEVGAEAAARLWALSEWMVQENSTYLDAMDGLAVANVVCMCPA